MELSFSLRVLTFSSSQTSNDKIVKFPTLRALKKIFIIKSKYPNSSMSISKFHFETFPATSKFEILDTCRHLDCDPPTYSTVSYFIYKFSRVYSDPCSVSRSWGRGDMVAAVRVAIGKNRKLPSVSRGCNRRRNECHPGIMSSITIFM